MTDYLTPADCSETVVEIKKSRFIAWLAPAEDRDAALAWLEKARTDYPDARHHCWAYLIGPPAQPQTLACSDDGEPSGTAGKPILNVMQHKEVGDAVVIVTRYFGGIKLGAGGLVRAYSQAAQQAYDDATLIVKVSACTLALTCDFRTEQSLRHWVESHNGHIIHAEYGEHVTLHLRLPEQEREALTLWSEQFQDIRWLEQDGSLRKR
ncbi:MAG: YigZ family protein [Oleiphilaceae bacterium]|nr:YigZ family protein [Oleiphilaceae bacterium]